MTTGRTEQAALAHHGDVDARGARLDLAVNVAVPEPPAFVTAAIGREVARLAAYPDPRAATAALAEDLGVPAGCLLLTNGSAEAFQLVARLRPWRGPVVVEPQFTEPGLELVAAGTAPAWHALDEGTGWALDADLLRDRHPDADLVVVGNPTNPTSRLHPRAELLRLVDPATTPDDRVLLVDEAFLDVSTDPTQTLVADAVTDRPGERAVLVTGSLTKTYGLAGVRAGFLVGPAPLVARLAQRQVHWSVNSLALAAVLAVCTPQGRAFRDAQRERLVRNAGHLAAMVRELGLRVPVDPGGPFVLAHHPHAEQLRERLRDEHGIAVRRADTFRGLDPTWIRIAARDPEQVAELADGIRTILQEPRP
ncbi:aminotransferase class I/II-fold pyridoxal phosphate-dependent enzyme [Arsenicicoccus dermatophilus]|uniref:aminotransferase class I/II-fold pyridoxal phosphate-dependent enzyme n=1 Tax=Arsenicicoccus dermatophilus TaxID=1076331 RepID=UPI003916F261